MVLQKGVNGRIAKRAFVFSVRREVIDASRIMLAAAFVLVLVALCTRIPRALGVDREYGFATSSLLFIAIAAAAFRDDFRSTRISRSVVIQVLLVALTAFIFVWKRGGYPTRNPVAFVVSVFGSAVVEEVFFRIALVAYFFSRFRSFKLSVGARRLSAVILSALIFALGHQMAPGNFESFGEGAARTIRLVVIGTGYTCLVLTCGLALTVCTHALFNLIAMTPGWYVESQASWYVLAAELLLFVAILHFGISRIGALGAAPGHLSWLVRGNDNARHGI